MIRIETPGAWYGEQLPNGRFITGFNTGLIQTSEGNASHLPVLIYPRINPAQSGFIGITNPGDQATEYVPGVGFRGHGDSCGVSSSAFWPDGRVEVVPRCVAPYGGQGIRWIDDRIHPGDETIADPVNGIWQYTEHNGIKVGQGGEGIHGADPIVVIIEGVRRLLEPGKFSVVRFNYDPVTATLGISAWKMDGNSNVRFVIQLEEVYALPEFPLHAVEPVPPINKPCYLAWFEFNQPPPQMPPGNALIKIRYEDSGSIVNLGGSRFATWVDGATVEEIEAKVHASAYPCIAYWDGPAWPRYPQLRPQDWLCVYGYSLAGEPPAQFESALRGLVVNAQRHHPKIAINCQCYTSNLSLTTNLAGLVPVYARVARDFSSVTMLSVFSDQNRATGLNDHPEVRPLWHDLYNGITGEPNFMADPEILPEDIYNKLVELRPKYPTPMGRRAAELLNETALHFPGWGLESKQGGNVCEQPQTGVTCGCDILRLPHSGYDCLVDAEGVATPVRGSRGDADPSRFVDPVGEIVIPGQISLRFQSYQTLVRRSDPKGFTLYWDMDSPRPITYVEAQLLGAPEVFSMSILPPFPPDGRYFRGLSWKPTQNGVFTPRLLVRDDLGNEAQIDGVQITVEP